MKKIARTVAVLLLATQLNAQTTDTVCEMVRGKCNYTFDYRTNERIFERDTCNDRHVESVYHISKNKVLCLHLYDKDRNKILFHREITLYYRDNTYYKARVSSKSEIFYIDGKEVYTVEVSKPIL